MRVVLRLVIVLVDSFVDLYDGIFCGVEHLVRELLLLAMQLYKLLEQFCNLLFDALRLLRVVVTLQAGALLINFLAHLCRLLF